MSNHSRPPAELSDTLLGWLSWLDVVGLGRTSAAVRVTVVSISGFARSRLPDLILLDIQLPDIPGTEVAALLKGDADLSHIPVVAVSAFVADGLEDEAFEAGCEAFVTKPITMAGFISTVEEFLN